ncbi:MAG: hypothetical protein EZS28_004120 [Streblomastix strix]|uniref:Protein kinase domain-containing protein n=1 Tax=Streblomastix strix TaxID=222440 RepID=A0A5J4WZJ4_9EUKA|nr:MAG: hypothetical protein EZS28_004120 [Streblomastix strix]
MMFMFEKAIERSPEVKYDVLWDLLTKMGGSAQNQRGGNAQMLKLDRKERIFAADALNHEFFTDQSITQYDTDPLFIVSLPEIHSIIGIDIEKDSAHIDSTDKINQSLTLNSETDNIPQQSFENKPSQSVFELEQDISNSFSGANSLTKQTTAQITEQIQNKQKQYGRIGSPSNVNYSSYEQSFNDTSIACTTPDKQAQQIQDSNLQSSQSQASNSFILDPPPGVQTSDLESEKSHNQPQSSDTSPQTHSPLSGSSNPFVRANTMSTQQFKQESSNFLIRQKRCGRVKPAAQPYKEQNQEHSVPQSTSESLTTQSNTENLLFQKQHSEMFSPQDQLNDYFLETPRYHQNLVTNPYTGDNTLSNKPSIQESNRLQNQLKTRQPSAFQTPQLSSKKFIILSFEAPFSR